MRARAALIVVAGAVLAFATGCGATFNGTSRTVTVRSSTPGAEVYINGGLAGKAPATFVTGNAASQLVTVRAPGYEDKDIPLVPKVKAAGIVCDVLWSFTIIGIAAPISDGLLGTFIALEPAEIDVVLQRERVEGPTPVREVSYATGDIVLLPAAPPSAPPVDSSGIGAAKPCKSHVDCKDGLVCPEGECVAPTCRTAKECGVGKSCSVEGVCERRGSKKK